MTCNASASALHRYLTRKRCHVDPRMCQLVSANERSKPRQHKRGQYVLMCSRLAMCAHLQMELPSESSCTCALVPINVHTEYTGLCAAYNRLRRADTGTCRTCCSAPGICAGRCFAGRSTHLVARKAWVCTASDQGEYVASKQHLNDADARVWWIKLPPKLQKKANFSAFSHAPTMGRVRWTPEEHVRASSLAMNLNISLAPWHTCSLKGCVLNILKPADSPTAKHPLSWLKPTCRCCAAETTSMAPKSGCTSLRRATFEQGCGRTGLSWAPTRATTQADALISTCAFP